ncbi:MAG: DUF2087 domain-containing protein [Rhodobacteraceae bacterium]|jgi:hypothetical protein|nr:DUF2087 domain-containing protein [Paracoccaceae bacterium]
MTRDTIPLHLADASAFARALAAELSRAPAPSHLALLNMLARSAGFRNLQHLRASGAAQARLACTPPLPNAAAETNVEVEAEVETTDLVAVGRVLPFFDAAGRLRQWPARRGVQSLCLWVLWSHLPRGVAMTEREVSALLDRWHLFGDPALLRRDMVGLGLLSRRPGGTDYRRVEQRPPPEARALFARV